MNRVPVRLVGGPVETPPGWAWLRPSACPCCAGRVQLQVNLVQLVREQRPAGVLIELQDRSHRYALRRTLGEWPFSEYVAVVPD